MALAIFDLDNTLLNGDSDYLWGRFLAAQGRVDGERYEAENHRFYEEYKRGQLDILEFLAFSLRPLSEIPPQELAALHQQFMEQEIRPRITHAARALIDRHRKQDDFLLIITATNRFITAPIAAELGVDDLLATDPEMVDGRYTGQISGIPCFREGKVQRLEQWLKQTGLNLADSWFYSDSHNDLPLLERVTYPVANYFYMVTLYVRNPDKFLEFANCDKLLHLVILLMKHKMRGLIKVFLTKSFMDHNKDTKHRLGSLW